MNALRGSMPRTVRRAHDEVLPHGLRAEGRERRRELGQRDETPVERFVGAAFVVVPPGPPEACAAPANEPIGQAIRESRQLLRGPEDVVCVHGRRHVPCGQGKLAQDPPIELRAVRRWDGRLRVGIEAIDIAVNREERVHVAELDRELLLERTHVRQRVARARPWRTRGEEEPTKCIRPRSGCRRVLERDALFSRKARHADRQNVGGRRGKYAEGRPIVGMQHDDATPEFLVDSQDEIDGAFRSIASIQAHRSAFLQIEPVQVFATDERHPDLSLRPVQHRELHRHLVEDDLRRRVVAAALAFLLSLPIENVPEHHARLVRTGQRVIPEQRRTLEDEGRDHEQRVEPAARLIDTFADEVRRKALLELGDALVRVSPLRERHAPGVEPGVDDLRDAMHPSVAMRTGKRYLVDPGLVDDEMFAERRIRAPRRVEVIERVPVTRFDLRNAEGYFLVLRVRVAHPHVERRSPPALA